MLVVGSFFDAAGPGRTMLYFAVRGSCTKTGAIPLASPQLPAQSPSDRSMMLVLVLLGLALRAWVIQNIPLEPEFDFRRYFEAAASLVTNGALANAGHPYIIQGPGYPLLLASAFSALGIGILQGKLLNISLYLGSMILTDRIAERLAVPRTIKALMLATIALHPGLIFYVIVLGTELLPVFLVLACILFSLSPSRPSRIALGIFSAALSLTRPQFLPVIFIFIIFSGGGLAELRRTVAFSLIPFVFVMTPWVVRNYQVFDSLIPVSASTGYISLVNNNDAANGFWMPLARVPISEEDKKRFDQSNNPGLFEVGNDGEKVIRWSPYNDHVAKSIAIKWIASHPAKFISLGAERLRISFFSSEGNMLFWPLRAIGSYNWMLNIIKTLNLLLLPLVAISLLIMVYRRKYYWRAGLVPTLIFFGGLGAIFVFEGQGRYVLPLLPAALTLASLPMANALRS